jgi:hypothetical protein
VQDSTGQQRDPSIKRRGGLEIEENTAAQHRHRAIQRIGRVIAAVVLLLGLTGLLGGGPLSRHSISDGTNSIDYERIGYRETSQLLRFTIPTTLTPSGKTGISFDNAALARIKLERIVPEPSAARLAAGRTVFEFNLARDTGRDAQVLFAFQPSEAGVHTTRLRIDTGPTLELTQIVLP